MIDKLPKISVITVSRNAEKTIERTILSVIRQKYPNMEYIIIDGASSDRTTDIINKYREHYSYYISEPDEGIYYAMNKGLKAATGDYVIFLNSDDCFKWDALENAAPYIKDSNAEVLYGDIVGVKNGEMSYIHPWPLESVRWCVPFCHQAVFLKWDRKTYFDTQYRIAADYNMLYELYMTGAKFIYMPFTVSYFSLNGVSSNYYKTNLEVINISCTKMIKYEKELELYRPRMVRMLVRSVNRYRYEQEENCNSIINYFKTKQEIHKDFILFGVGDILSRFWKIVDGLNIHIKYFVDNNPKKWGQTYSEIEIKSPDALKYETDCIICLMTDRYVEDILEQLDLLQLNNTVSVISFPQLKKEYDAYSQDEIIKFGKDTIPSFKTFMEMR
jgi:glycosyltransferase involved in cell wall biosynthesis